MKLMTSTLALVAALSAGPALADDLALVLVNSDYKALSDLRGDGYASRFERELESAGFTTFALQDGSASAMRSLARNFAQATSGGDDNRVVIVVSGHLVHTDGETYLLGSAADRPDGFSAGEMGLPLSPLLTLAATAPGRAAVLVVNPDDEAQTGVALTPGAGDLTLPQGVTMARGEIRLLLTALRDGLLSSDMTFARAAQRAPRGVTYDGFLSASAGLLTGAETAPIGPARPDPGDFAYWNASQDIGTEEAFRAYLDRYPDGTFAADARARIAGLKDAPLRAAQATEDQLNLTREARREVQRYLTLLGFNTRGVDGIFGPATRTALTSWQTAHRFEASGYLDGKQLLALRSEGAAKAAELERDAAARRAAEEQKDRDYWARTGSLGDKDGLKTYLDRYPDGIFADTAKDRLERIAQNEQDQAATEIRGAWDKARSEDTEAAYIRFLRTYPDSPFDEAARSRISELRRPPGDEAAEAAARQEEATVAGNQITRLLVERRLQQLGFQPGTPDGEFDAETRRALRRFQEARGLDATGYVTQATMVRLLAG